MTALVFKSGRRLPVHCLFFDLPSVQASPLASQLGCEFDSKGGILCGEYEATRIPGLYVAGNVIKDVHLAIVAAAEGAKAALGISKALIQEDFETISLA